MTALFAACAIDYTIPSVRDSPRENHLWFENLEIGSCQRGGGIVEGRWLNFVGGEGIEIAGASWRS